MKTTPVIETPSNKIPTMNLTISIPADHKRRIQLEAMMLEKSAGTMIEEWIDQNVSPESVVISLEGLIKEKDSTEVLDPSVKMLGLSTPISRRHHALLRLESLRTNTPIRNLVRQWIEENTKEWRFNLERKGSAINEDVAELAA